MEICITKFYDDYEREVTAEEMTIDGVDAYSVRNLTDCPEDAILRRDLTSSEEVVALMRRAYDAGLCAEKFNVVTVTEGGDEE